MLHDTILDYIGDTPIVRLIRIPPHESEVYVKLESMNPMGSIKDRIALSMIEDAESRGLLSAGGCIVEATSGNTGIGLAMVAAVKGYRLIIVMPESMSLERRQLLKAMGAELILTPASEGMSGSLRVAEELAEKGAFMPSQFSNPANVMAHYKGTAQEILRQLPDVETVVMGIGTGGTITGVGRAMHELKSPVYIVGVEPAESPLISEGRAAPHSIEGIGPDFIPEILDLSVVDEVRKASFAQAREVSRRLAREEGILAGPSSGAALHAAIAVAQERGGKTLAILPDSGQRYMSTGIFDYDD
ncbi:MAG: cysteine synthase [Candidatus Methanomethylophilaceae archaeon]|nr:cysteine synthase [Candidatus Methanomethylophilaceae archaeon]MDI3541909.1 cysteine synthase [Candidatus Methanomethylophilaceae archaeon]